MPIDPTLEAWRQKYVAEQDVLNRANRAQQTAELTRAQADLSRYLEHTDLDMIIRTVIRDLHQTFSATRIIKGQLPLEGELIEGYNPVFIIDHQGLPGYRQRFEIPGLRYRFYIEHREFVITATFCKSKESEVFPYLHLTHRNDLTHLINWNSSLKNPNNQQLNFWLIDQITGLISKRYPEQAKSETIYTIPATSTRSFFPEAE